MLTSSAQHTIAIHSSKYPSHQTIRDLYWWTWGGRGEGKERSPSPQGDFLVVIWSTLVGIRTGPLILRSLPLAPFTRSPQTAQRKTRSVLRFQPNAAGTNKGNGIHRHATEHGLIAASPFSRFLTLLEESVMRILCCGSIRPASNPALPDFIGGAYATSAAAMARGWVEGRRIRALGFRLVEGGGEKWRRRVLARFWGARGSGVYVEAGGGGETPNGRWMRWEVIWPLDRGFVICGGWGVSMTVGPLKSTGPACRARRPANGRVQNSEPEELNSFHFACMYVCFCSEDFQESRVCCFSPRRTVLTSMFQIWSAALHFFPPVMKKKDVFMVQICCLYSM